MNENEADELIIQKLTLLKKRYSKIQKESFCNVSNQSNTSQHHNANKTAINDDFVKLSKNVVLIVELLANNNINAKKFIILLKALIE